MGTLMSDCFYRDIWLSEHYLPVMTVGASRLMRVLYVLMSIAVEIGLFAALANGGKSITQLASELKITMRAANAMVATLCGLKLLSMKKVT